MSSAIRRILPKSVANTGSQQRDHHANERTFLSWTRAGLGFAAMALALDRLDAIDRLLTSKLPSLAALGSAQTQPQPQTNSTAPATSAATSTNPSPSHIPGNGHCAIQSQSMWSIPGFEKSFSASKVCQVLGLWSLGYGFFRYWSMRRYLLRGQFVPAFWGPVFMTAGSFAAFMTLGLKMDRRHHS